MTQFYVTMTWHDFPEGGSFGTVLNAKDHTEAENECRLEMADTIYGECFNQSDEEQESPADILADHGSDWHLIDCFELDHFIGQHAGPVHGAAPDLLTALESVMAVFQGRSIFASTAHELALAAIAKAKGKDTTP